MPNNQNPNQTNASEVRRQNQQSAQKSAQQQTQMNLMGEEFASETDVNQVKMQNQQAEANKQRASSTQTNQFENGSR